MKKFWPDDLLGNMASRSHCTTSIWQPSHTNFPSLMTTITPNSGFTDAHDYVRTSAQFFNDSIRHYESEPRRKEACKSFLEEVFGEEIDSEEIGIAKSELNGKRDGSSVGVDLCTTLTLTGNKKLHPILIQVKAREGDYLTQCLRHDAEMIFGFKRERYFNSTSFPVVFIGVYGHVLTISIAVSHEYIIANEVLQLAMFDDINSQQTIVRLYCIASALAECSRGLEDEYKALDKATKSRKPRRPFFPDPTPIPVESTSRHAPPRNHDASLANITPPEVVTAVEDDEFPENFHSIPKLKFSGFIDREKGHISVENYSDPSPEQMRSLFVATMHIATLDAATNRRKTEAVEVIVKFTRAYSARAHLRLAKEGLAPKLYHCIPVVGGVFMVVMERLAGCRLSYLFLRGEDAVPQSVFDDLERVLELLGGLNLVHGDLRAANIIIDETGTHAKVIDFDWVGEDGEGRYPANVNKEKLSDQWHEDVDGDVVMRKEHDEFAVRDILKRRYWSGS